MTPTLHQAVDRAAAMYEREAALRERARQVELVPSRREEARRAYRAASRLHRMRLALLRQWKLI